VLVHVGDRVRADDVVAQAPREGRLYTIDLATGLGLSVAAIARRTVVTPGQPVTEGMILASRQILWVQRVVKSPVAGVVQGVVDGRIVIRETPEMFRLRAYLPGEVVELYPHRGVAIRGAGALVRGIWGCGQEGQGPLMITASDPGEVLTLEKVSLRYRGMILVGGVLEDARVLQRARRFRIKGLILGSLSPGLRPACEQQALPMVVTEGVGRIPLAEPVFSLLCANQGKPVVMSGGGGSGHGEPEVILPQEGDGPAMALMVVRPLEVGARVRLARPPYVGAMGQVVAVPALSQETPIGTRVAGAEVRLEDGRKVFAPYVNMELLE
jgi:hypothetical protein